MVITWVSKEGGREVNEDAFGKAKAKGIVCVVVADGLGGHNGGKIASELVVNTVIDAFIKNPGFSKEHLNEYITKAKENVVGKAMSDPALLYMSSTVVVLLIKGRKAIWANAGDSRLYRFYNGKICEVSEDHSVAFLDFVRGDIEYSDIRTSHNQNKLTSAIGMSMDSVNYSSECKINGSTAFLLCTDGWWEYVTEEDMDKIFSEKTNSRDCLEAMLKIREENAPKDSDNFTAVVVMI